MRMVTMTSDFGHRLRLAREIRGLSRAQLARKAELDQSYIYRLERGDHPRPSGQTLEALARGLDMPVEMLLDEQTPLEKPVPRTFDQLAREIYDVYFSDSDLPFEDVARGISELLNLAERPEVFRIVAQQLHGLQREREIGRREGAKRRKGAKGGEHHDEHAEPAEANGESGGGG